MSKGKLGNIDLLRIIACLMVMYCHFGGDTTLLAHPELKNMVTTARFGAYGVNIFFVISGFIIPYSLYQGGYVISKYFVFLWKRILRLYPNYLVSLFVALALCWLSSLSSLYKGSPFYFSWIELGAHLTFLNLFFNLGDYNGVYWSLTVEWQYYLLVALFLPLFFSKKAWMARLSTWILGLSFIPFMLPQFNISAYGPNIILFYQGPFFALGFFAFHYFRGTSSLSVASLDMACMTIVMTLLGRVSDPILPLLGLFSGLAIMLLHWENPLTTFLGNISYSLYLFHLPIGVRTMHLLLRYSGGTAVGSLAVCVIAFAVSFILGIICYYLFEKPFILLGAKFRYQPKKTSIPPTAST